MAFAGSKVFIITANLGTYFENEAIQKSWLQVFDEFLAFTQPQLVALHCQEVGGKHFQESIHKVDTFPEDLLALPMMKNYSRSRCFIDKSAALLDTHFTALGSFYFIHNSVEHAELWNFKAKRFEVVEGHQTVSDGLDLDPYNIKEKFPVQFFPEVRWTRKGFMLCRWRLFERTLNLVNIHLFHDEDNFISLDKDQRRYNEYRQNALLHTLDRIGQYSSQSEVVFLFGDFNFRLDCPEVVKHIVGDMNMEVHEVTGDEEKRIVYRKSHGNKMPVLTVMRKSFVLTEDDAFTKRYMELRKFDKESEHFPMLAEIEIEFQPSYPFSEDVNEGRKYLTKRCPAWCDRVLMNPTALKFVEESPIDPDYNLLGKEICVGDHKPVYLLFDLQESPPTVPPST